MDQSLLIFSLVCFLVCIAALVYCFLSTCLGVRIRRADILEAIATPSRTNHYRPTPDFELDDMEDHRWHRNGMQSLEAIEMIGSRPPRQFF